MCFQLVRQVRQVRQLISEPQIRDLSPEVQGGITDPNRLLSGGILRGFGVRGRIVFTPPVGEPQNGAFQNLDIHFIGTEKTKKHRNLNFPC